jgi:hypothetical protein
MGPLLYLRQNAEIHHIKIGTGVQLFRGPVFGADFDILEARFKGGWERGSGSRGQGAGRSPLFGEGIQCYWRYGDTIFSNIGTAKVHRECQNTSWYQDTSSYLQTGQAFPSLVTQSLQTTWPLETHW